MTRWFEIFDADKTNGRASRKDVEDIVRNFNPREHEPPIQIGHTSDYPKDTRIPAMGWIGALKNIGPKIYARARELPPISNIPDGFKDLKDFFDRSKFLKEIVDKEYFSKRSVELGRRKEDGSRYLKKLGLLGAVVPECKGMPNIAFSEAPQLKDFLIEFSDEEFDEIVIEDTMADNKTKKNLFDQLKEFAELDPSKLSDEELTALTEVIDKVKVILGLNEGSSLQEVLGAIKTSEAGMADYMKGKAAIGEHATSNGGAVSQFSELLKGALDEFAEKTIKPLKAELDTIKQKQAEFAEGDPTSGGGGDDGEQPAADEQPVETLKKKSDDCGKEADQVKTDLETAKNWPTAFDELKAIELFKILANVKYGDKSALEGTKELMMVVKGVTELAEHLDYIESHNFAERNRIEREQPSGFKAPAGAKIVGTDVSAMVEEYMEKHEGTTYEQATDILTKQGKIR